jgi:hypothetical protein
MCQNLTISLKNPENLKRSLAQLFKKQGDCTVFTFVL